MRVFAIGIVAVATAASAEPRGAPRAHPEVESLAKALPAGWHVTIGGGDLVIERSAPVHRIGMYLENSPHNTSSYVPASTTGPAITLALRYRIAPRWTANELVGARAANAKLYAELAALRARHRIDDIPTSKGRPLPATADDQRRLTAYEADHARISRRLVRLPRCTLGDSSVFDSAETYGQLDLIVDPPSAMREAYAIVELVKRRCRAIP